MDLRGKVGESFLFLSCFCLPNPRGQIPKIVLLGIHTHAQIIMLIRLHTCMYVCTYVTRGIYLPRVQDLVVILWLVTHKF